MTHPSMTRFLSLNSRRTTVMLEVRPDEAPLWRYWGPRLQDGVEPCQLLRDERPLPSYTLDFDQPLSLAPSFGVGWFGQSALLAHREGRDFAQAFTRCEVATGATPQHLTIQLHDDVAQLRLDVHLQLDADSDVLTMQSTLHNTGIGTLDVQLLAAGTLPLPGHAQCVRFWAGQHMHEFLEQNEPLTRSLWMRESRRGRTTHDTFPMAVVSTPGVTDDSGLVFGAHLAWSGNHRQVIEWLPDGLFQWQWGEWLAPGEVRLEPGQSLASPELVASCSVDGFNGLAQNFHHEARRRLNWPGGAMRPRPVHLNTWEGFYFDVHPEPVKQLATAAAEVGIERFVLDDGWFHGRHHDRAALGDWWPDETKFPQGLGELIAHVNSLGMAFGLWVEPEMVNPDSELFRAHPEWALQIAGRPLLTARNQLVLDISRPEVSDYLFEKISALLAAHPIDYLKWDHNRDLTTAGLAQGQAGYRAQVNAAYALMARLRAAHPSVEIESCSGGGGRIDFGVLRHTHRFWASDCIDALSRIDIQRGFLQFFPPEVMGAHVGTAPAHTTGRTQSMAFRGAVALSGHLGVELDVRQLGDAERAELKAWIGLYKQWRDRLHHGRVWQGGDARQQDGLVWQVHGDHEGDGHGGAEGGEAGGQVGRDFLLLAYRPLPSQHRYAPPVRLPMLNPQARYRVREVRPDGHVRPTGRHHTAPFFDAINTPDGLTVDGAWLVHSGLPMPRVHAETAFIVHLQRV
jgi:alpha-galactosidase